MKEKYLSPALVKSFFVDKTKNTLVVVMFRKKDGSMRVLHGMTNVKVNIKGVGKSFKDSDYGLITLFDMKIGEYRSFDVNKVVAIEVVGQSYHSAYRGYRVLVKK